MSTTITFALWKAFPGVSSKVLPPVHRLVLLCLAYYAGDADGKAWPSAATISSVTGQSVRTVETCLAELEQAGMVLRPISSGGA